MCLHFHNIYFWLLSLLLLLSLILLGNTCSHMIPFYSVSVCVLWLCFFHCGHRRRHHHQLLLCVPSTPYLCGSFSYLLFLSLSSSSLPTRSFHQLHHNHRHHHHHHHRRHNHHKHHTTDSLCSLVWRGRNPCRNYSHIASCSHLEHAANNRG